VSIAIYTRTPNALVPRPVTMILTCDGDHGLFEPPSAEFATYDAAMRAGWKETYINDRRCFLGPCCSGKPVK
jgi:hypothetical protein